MGSAKPGSAESWLVQGSGALQANGTGKRAWRQGGMPSTVSGWLVCVDSPCRAGTALVDVGLVTVDGAHAIRIRDTAWSKSALLGLRRGSKGRCVVSFRCPGCAAALYSLLCMSIEGLRCVCGYHNRSHLAQTNWLLGSHWVVQSQPSRSSAPRLLAEEVFEAAGEERSRSCLHRQAARLLVESLVGSPTRSAWDPATHEA